jgi:hypothetical protein
MEGDLLIASALASVLSRETAKTTGTTTNAPSPVSSGITQDQINQLSGVIGDAVQGAVSQIQIPAPQINIPPIEVPPAQVMLPDSIQASLSDAQIARIASAISTSGANQVYDILNRSVQVSYTGAGMHALVSPSSASFPQIVLLNQIQFIQDVRLVGIVLSASLLNTGTEPMGIYACRATGNIINLDPPSDPTIRANDIYLSIITHNNSTVGTNAPASRTASIGFSPKVSAVLMKAGSSIGIYGCAQNLASALLAGVLSVYYTTEE